MKIDFLFAEVLPIFVITITSMKKKRYILLIPALLLIGTAVLLYRQFTNNTSEYSSITTTQNKTATYVGVESCKECHTEAFEQWQGSHHFRAMELPSPESVLGDFDNAVFSKDGITSRFFQKDGKYFIHTEGDDGKYRDFEIKYTFGFYPLQQYLVAFDNGRLQVTRQSWDSREKRWFHQYENQKIPHDDWLHWTGNAQNWNLMCASCHSTNLQKNYDPTTDSYNTTFSHITVSCESCHGPASIHVEQAQQKNYAKTDNDGMWDISSQQAEILRCAPCHSRHGETGGAFIASNELLDNYIPEIPTTPNYFADGQVLEENYKYASFLQSKMYHSGVKCTDCHHPHSGKLKAEGNRLCLQCHLPETYQTEKHTFHNMDGEGSSCINCHMPTRTYMGNDIRHDHVFRVPRPDLSEKYDVPNSCNQCHSDKSAKWAAQWTKKWYGNSNKTQHFAENLIIGSLQNSESESHLLTLLEQENPNIIKAAALHYLGNQPTEKALSAIKKALQHDNAQVRYEAVKALQNFSGETFQQDIQPLLNDGVRAVRIASANLVLTQFGWEKAQIFPYFQKAFSDLEKFILNQSDFAVGSATAGDFYAKIGQLDKAVIFYERALQKDNQLNYVRLNLATLYNQNNDNERALSVLEQALKNEPENGDIFYRLALLSYELKKETQSEAYFKKAMFYTPNNFRIYYNYGLLLQQQGKVKHAEVIFKTGLQKQPENANLRYALYVLYAQQGEFEKAKQYQN